jgi:DNA-binding NtrC family response regulator
MKAIYGVVDEGGKLVRRTIILEDRVCSICGKTFSPAKQTSKFCSLSCSKKNDYITHKEQRKKNVAEWRERNIEKVTKRRKEIYWSNPEKYRQQTKEYISKHKTQKRATDNSYKDKIRHGDLRKVLIEQYGMFCQMCKKECCSIDLAAHHVSGDPTDHKNQTLLCRSCHAKVHNFGNTKRKDISKEQIEDALTKFKRLEDACEYLGITRSFLRKKRIEYGFPKRKVANGLGVRQRT